MLWGIAIFRQFKHAHAKIFGAVGFTDNDAAGHAFDVI
jgi:hypothetical protein